MREALCTVIDLMHILLLILLYLLSLKEHPMVQLIRVFILIDMDPSWVYLTLSSDNMPVIGHDPEDTCITNMLMQFVAKPLVVC